MVFTLIISRAELSFLSWVPRVAVTVPIMLLAAACGSPLALQHEYFAGPRATVTKIGADTRRTLRYVHASQIARRKCDAMLTTGASAGPDMGVVAAREALGDRCAVSNRSPAAWRGGTSNAYQRWADDRTLDLPDPADTASSVGGGS